MQEAQDNGRPALHLKVGGIDYLNAQPLVWCLERQDAPRGDACRRPQLEVRNHSPSRLASLLCAGDLDLALVPVVAYGERQDYHLVPGVGISSFGPVRSIRLYHRGPLDRARRVALDASSRTSALLTRLLFRERWESRPEFIGLEPAAILDALRGAPGGDGRRGAGGEGRDDLDAVLLIGDAALGGGDWPGWNDVDLGLEWTRWTGLPFVYAFWIWRAPPSAAAERRAVADCFIAARDEGCARIDEIVAAARRPAGMSESACRHYLTHVIQYDLRPDKIEGLDLFFRKLRAVGLADAADAPLRFVAGVELAASR